MSDERPLLFLDVDGVINCLCPQVPVQDFRVLSHGNIGIDVRVPLGTAERLMHLAESFEIVWATAWMESANAILKPLGIDVAWPTLQWDDLKLKAIPRFAGERPWAFIDDDMGFELRELERDGAPFSPDPGRQLLVESDAGFGLGDREVERLLSFAAAVRQPAA